LWVFAPVPFILGQPHRDLLVLSIGATHTDAGGTLEDFLHLADRALYRAL